ncbi:MAG: RloB family protein [Paenibacillaceae bacterium]
MVSGPIRQSARRVSTREPHKRIYMTELTYFNNFKSRRVNIDVRITKAKHTDPVNLVAEARKIISEKQLDVRSGIDEIWCVLDLDTSPDNEYVITFLTKARRANTKIAYSNPCFEIWFLLHFQSITGNVGVKQLMKKLLSEVPSYQKGKCIYSYIGDMTDQAISNGEKLEILHSGKLNKSDFKGSNPYTEVFKLVSNLKAYI